MKMNTLGRTGIQVSEICLGTMTWGRQNTEEEGHRQIDYALDQGINFIDTAEMYAIPPTAETYGKTEEIIGTWLARTGRRQEIVLASKVAGGNRRPWVRNAAPADGKNIRIAVEDSLRRLQTDYLDLYQIHWPSRAFYHFQNSWSYEPHGDDTAETLDLIVDQFDAMRDLIGQGKVRHFGLSNETAWGLMQFLRLAGEDDRLRVASVQNEYSFLRRYYDFDMAEVSHHEDVALLAYSPLGGGVLSGKYLDGARPAGSRGAIEMSYRMNEYTDPAIRAYIALAQEHDLDPCQMAIAFCLTRAFMTSVIIGATTMEQLETDIAAADLTLSEDVLDGIQKIYRRHARPL